MINTSQTHPLQIAPVEIAPGMGKIGVTFAPGERDFGAASGRWSRDLAADLEAIVTWPARALVTLIESHEFELLRIPTLGEEARRRCLDWLHLPIRDVSTPPEASRRSGPFTARGCGSASRPGKTLSSTVAAGWGAQA